MRLLERLSLALGLAGLASLGWVWYFDRRPAVLPVSSSGPRLETSEVRGDNSSTSPDEEVRRESLPVANSEKVDSSASSPTADSKAIPVARTLQDELGRRGVPFDGADFARARALFRAQALEYIVENPIYNPNAVQLAAEEEKALEALLGDADEALRKLDAARFVVERQHVIQCLESGSGFEVVELGEDGMFKQPAPSTPDEMVLLASHKGVSGAVRFRYGSLTARDELLWQQSWEIGRQEQRVIDYFRSLRR